MAIITDMSWLEFTFIIALPFLAFGAGLIWIGVLFKGDE
jgi:hypothetical protein